MVDVMANIELRQSSDRAPSRALVETSDSVLARAVFNRESTNL